jgi:hypothetical protein
VKVRKKKAQNIMIANVVEDFIKLALMQDGQNFIITKHFAVFFVNQLIISFSIKKLIIFTVKNRLF